MDTKHRKLHIALFMAYCALMVSLLFDRPGPIAGVPYWEQIKMSINFVPFRTVMCYMRLLRRRPNAYLIRHAVINLAGNVIMFIPLGFFLPMIWAKLRKLWRTLLTTGLIITLVELIQLFTLVGSCDIDDLILNLLGAAMGYGIYKLIK